jgi:hypothetical protein
MAQNTRKNTSLREQVLQIIRDNAKQSIEAVKHAWVGSSRPPPAHGGGGGPGGGGGGTYILAQADLNPLNPHVSSIATVAYSLPASRPALRTPYTEPTFGTTIQRLATGTDVVPQWTGAANQKWTSRAVGLTQEYSRLVPMSIDNAKMLLRNLGGNDSGYWTERNYPSMSDAADHLSAGRVDPDYSAIKADVSQKRFLQCDSPEVRYYRTATHDYATIVSPTYDRAWVLTVALNAGGTGYAVNDVLTLVGGTFDQAATFRVSSVSGGVVTGIVRKQGGTYTVKPGTTGIATTVVPAGGSGCTLNLTYSDIGAAYFYVSARNEGMISDDGLYVALMAYDSSSPTLQADIIVVDIVGGVVSARLRNYLDDSGNSELPNHCSMSPSGLYVAVGAGQHCKLYDRATMTFQRILFPDICHWDWAVGTGGVDVVVYELVTGNQVAELGSGSDVSGIAKVKWDGTAKTAVHRFPDYFHSVHICGIPSRAHPGWILCEMYHDTLQAHNALYHEIFFLNFETGEIRRVGHHHSLLPRWGGDYWAEPRVTCNWDATKIFFTSNWSDFGIWDGTTYKKYGDLLATKTGTSISVACVAHGMTPGDFINIKEATDFGYQNNAHNGSTGGWQTTVTTVPDADHFTYTVDIAPTSVTSLVSIGQGVYDLFELTGNWWV